MARVFAFRWPPGDWRAERLCRDLWRNLASESNWTKFIDRRGVLAHFALEPRDHAPLELGAERGAIFGAVFDGEARGAGPITSLDDGAAETLSESGGEALLCRYWGDYFALLHDRRRDVLHVLREPTLGAPVLIGAADSFCTICTHASDHLAVAPDTAVDEEFLSAFLAHPRLVTRRTAIEGLSELLPGERISMGRELHQVMRGPAWRPVAKAKVFKIEEFESAACGLRDVVLQAAASWASTGRTIVHRLSGGLDSSIVLAAMTGAKADIVAFNEFAPLAPEGDERPFARAMADHVGIDLVETAMAPSRVDYKRLARMELPAKPSRAYLSLADETVADAIAAFDPNPLVTSGQGGDQILHRARLPVTAADAWRDGVRLRDLAAFVFDLAIEGRKSLAEVAAAVARHGLLRQPFEPGAEVAQMTLLDGGRGLSAARRLALDHPWIDDTQEATPARALRISHLADLQYYRQRDGLGARFAVAPVLASRPIVEHCLNAPPYLMIHRGRDRAMARAAFADMLAPAVLNRSIKGATTRYHTAVFEKQIPFLREALIGGHLEKRGLIDGAALRSALAAHAPRAPGASVALTTALLAELWIQSFERRRAKINADLQSGQSASSAL